MEKMMSEMEIGCNSSTIDFGQQSVWFSFYTIWYVFCTVMGMLKSKMKPYFMIIAGYLIWSVNFSIYSYLFPKFIEPMAMSTLTLVVCGVLMLATRLFGPWEKIDKHDLLKFAIAALLIGFLKKSLMMVGMADTTPIDAAIISSIGPIIVLIISVVFKVDKITIKKLLGIGLGLLGTAIIIFNNDKSGVVVPHRLLGNVIIFLSTLSSAFYLVWIKGLITKYKALTLLRGVYLFAALFALPFAIYYAPHIEFHKFTTEVWALFFFVLLIPTLVPNFLFLIGLRYIKPTIVSVYAYIMPVMATIMSIILHQDALSWIKAIAGIIVFVGVFLVVRSYSPSNPQSVHQQ